MFSGGLVGSHPLTHWVYSTNPETFFGDEMLSWITSTSCSRLFVGIRQYLISLSQKKWNPGGTSLPLQCPKVHVTDLLGLCPSSPSSRYGSQWCSLSQEPLCPGLPALTCLSWMLPPPESLLQPTNPQSIFPKPSWSKMPLLCFP